MRTPVADELQRLLFDVDYPASKAELLAVARQRGAGEDAVRALRGLPPVEYRSESELLRSIDVEPGERAGRDPSDAGPARREHTHRGLAEHMKETERPPVQEELESGEQS